MATVDGFSSDEEIVEMELHLRWVRLRVSPWVEFVKSGANIADLPSRVPDVGVREATRVLRELGAVRVSFVMPPYVSFWG